MPRDALLIIAPPAPAHLPLGSRGLKAGERASYIILDLRSPEPEWVVLTIPPSVTVDMARSSINKEEDPWAAFVIKHRVTV